MAVKIFGLIVAASINMFIRSVKPVLPFVELGCKLGHKNGGMIWWIGVLKDRLWEVEDLVGLLDEGMS